MGWPISYAILLAGNHDLLAQKTSAAVHCKLPCGGNQGVQTMIENPGPKCAACGGPNLQFGALSRTGFVPKGRTMLSGYPIVSFVCMDCCYVGNCLSRDNVEDIRENASKRK